MTSGDWEGWAGRALQARHLHEPPAATLQAAIDIGRTARRRHQTWSRFGLAAAAALVVMIGGALLFRTSSPLLPTRTPEIGVRGTTIELVSPLGQQAQPPRVLSWMAVDEAEGYRVTIRTVDAEPLWEQVVPGSSVSLPDDVRERFQRATSYHWQVEAIDGTGATVARSEAAQFRVAR